MSKDFFKWDNKRDDFLNSIGYSDIENEYLAFLNGTKKLDKFLLRAMTYLDFSVMDKKFIQKCKSLGAVFIVKPNSKMSVDVTKLDVSHLTNLSSVFCNNKDFNQDISNWNVSNVKNMSSLFYKAEMFNQDISNWDVSNVRDMSNIFCEAKGFNQPIGVSETTIEEDSFINRITGEEVDINSYNLSDLSDKTLAKHNIILEKRSRAIYNKGWDTSNVINMRMAFAMAYSFNQDISSWNVSNVRDMSSLFFSAKKFNQPLNNWNVSNVTIMKGLFKQATDFNQNINDWDVSKVTSMEDLFSNAYTFNQPLYKWNVLNVINMRQIFINARSFNQYINNWDVSNVETFEYAFSGTDSFKQYLGDWGIKNQYIHGIYIYGYTFNENNFMHEFGKERLIYFINKNNESHTDLTKYELIRYMKNFANHYDEMLKTLLTEIQLNGNFNLVENCSLDLKN
jgi:surface protein